MVTRDDDRPAVPAAWLAFAAWTPYLPVGLQYTGFLVAVLLATRALHRERRLASALRHPLHLAAALWWGWLALSALWSPAPARELVAHLWTYALMLGVAPLALAIRTADARRALGHFVAASALIGAAQLAVTLGGLAPPTLVPFVPFNGYGGNQRIAVSIGLALALAIAAWSVLQAPRGRDRTWAAAAALACLGGLLVQDRRSGLLLMPLLLAALAASRPVSWRRRTAGAGAVLALALVAAAAVPNVQQRFAEGWAELRAYAPQGPVQTSWGMRRRMAEQTWQMVAERPWAGHGAGSWTVLWRRRTDTTAGLAEHSTPHSEALLQATQGGLVALLLLARVAWRGGLGAWRRGRAGQPALLLLTAAAAAGLFNAVLRDAKFALPLMILAALAWAASRTPAVSSPPQLPAQDGERPPHR